MGCKGVWVTRTFRKSALGPKWGVSPINECVPDVSSDLSDLQAIAQLPAPQCMAFLVLS